MPTTIPKDAAEPRGDAPRAPELAATLLGYRLVHDTAQDNAFQFAGSPVSLISLTAVDLATYPPRVQAHVTVTGAWVFVTTPAGTTAIADTPSTEKVTWTLGVSEIEAVYAPALPEAPPPVARRA